MPEKSVREMSRREREHHSLEARVFHATLMGSIILGLVALVLGLGLYILALVDQYTGDAFDVTRSASLILEKVSRADSFSEELMAIYGGMSEEERQEVGTEAYYERFRALEQSPDYQTIRSFLNDFRMSSDISDIYLAMYTRGPSRLVYIVDPDDSPDDVRRPGDWEGVRDREADTFLDLKWSSKGRLYDISMMKPYGWICTAGVPIRNEAHEIVGFVLADITLTQIGRSIRGFVLQFALAMFLVVNLIGYFMTRRMKKTVVQPINDIAEAAQAYARDKRAGVPVTEHFSLLNIRTGDEVENLSLVMADMEQDLSGYEEDLTRAAAEKERISTELDLARRIQESMLPRVFPPFPGRTDFDIYASMTPAKEVGGDFYDFFLIDETHLGLVMADVSGKGIPAALFMMIAKILIQNYVLSGRSPREVLGYFNDQICQNNPEEMFITVWLGVLDLATGRLTAANAGHERPVLLQPGGRFELLKGKHDFVVGGLAGMSYRDVELQLQPGAKLFLYTDGVPEATSASNELFGMERCLQVLDEAADRSPQEILERVRRAVDAFVGSGPQFDDMTMLCVEYRGMATKEGDARVKEWTLEATLESIPALTDQVNAELEALDCPMKAQIQIDVAIDELLSNIAKYAYSPGTGEVTVRLEEEREPRAVRLSFLDSGMPFDPLATDDPDIALSAEERTVGGLGIFLVKKTMDGVDYAYRDGQNVLTIRKLL